MTGALLVPLASGLGIQAAFADEVSDAQSALDEAEAQLAQIQAEREALQQQAEELQSQIDEAVQGVMDAQAAVQEGRERLGALCSTEYKAGGISLVSVVLESQSLSELIDNIQYLETFQKAQADEIEAQQEREEAFNKALDDLDEKKDEQVQALADADAKAQEAQQVVDQASAELAQAQAEAEAARLAELQAQVAAMQAQIDSDSGSGSDDGTSEEGSSSGASEGGSSESSSSQGGWLAGIASAYGSTSDNTLGHSTATGAIVTEDSMGVAVPMSWPNYRSYFGRSVEISWGGMTVIAVVNDCGSMGGGSRSLDLQPGVWKAFGASSCYDWGLRAVTYRFL